MTDHYEYRNGVSSPHSLIPPLRKLCMFGFIESFSLPAPLSRSESQTDWQLRLDLDINTLHRIHYTQTTSTRYRRAIRRERRNTKAFIYIYIFIRQKKTRNPKRSRIRTSKRTGGRGWRDISIKWIRKLDLAVRKRGYDTGYDGYTYVYVYVYMYGDLIYI